MISITTKPSCPPKQVFIEIRLNDELTRKLRDTPWNATLTTKSPLDGVNLIDASSHQSKNSPDAWRTVSHAMEP
jgi:hypothetical protein